MDIFQKLLPCLLFLDVSGINIGSNRGHKVYMFFNYSLLKGPETLDSPMYMCSFLINCKGDYYIVWHINFLCLDFWLGL